jgi:hypothetical protein
MVLATQNLTLVLFFIIYLLNTIPYIHIYILTQQHISCVMRVTKTIALAFLPVIGL